MEKLELVSRIEIQLPSINLAIHNDEMRPTMNFGKIARNSEGQFWGTATNAHIAVKINFSHFFGNCSNLDQLATEFYFGPEAFSALAQRKAKYIKFNPESLIFKTLDKDFKVISIFEAVSLQEFTDKIGQFPDVDAIWPDMANKKEIGEIGYNYELITKIGKAMIPSSNYLPNLKFEFFGSNRPAIVTPASYEFREICKGLIMPVMITD